MKILGNLLSSEFMNWLFRKLFHTHKILKSDIESLPIHWQFLQKSYFDENEYIKNLGLEKTDNGNFKIAYSKN